jgi:hypothetical protein
VTSLPARYSGICAASGGVLALIGSLTTPSFDGDLGEVLEGVAASQWRPVALLLQLIGVVLLVVGVLGIAHILAERAGGWPAAAARPLVVIGGAIALVSLAVGMNTYRQLAEVYAAAPDADASTALGTAYVAASLLDALDAAWTLVLLGLVPVLLAVAMYRTRVFPAWLAALAVLGGAVGIVVGTTGLFAVDDLDLTVPALIGELLVAVAVIAAGALLTLRKVQP